MMMKFAERVEGKQGKRTAPGVRPHPDHVSRWWSPITSEVVGVSPSAEAQHLRSNSDKANARAAVHAMRTLHLRNQATIADFRTTSGSHLALASARALRKLLASVDHLPPTSQPSTTNLARHAMSPASSGYVLSLRLRACSNAAPLVKAHCLLVVPSRRIGETIVVSMANCAPLNRGRPSTTTSKRRLSTCLSGRRSISCTDIHGHSSACLSATLAAALSRANPRRPKTPATEQAARWWPRESGGRPHQQMDDDKGRGCQRRLRSNTRNSCG